MAKTPNRVVVEQWVEALESGRYKQGSGMLRSSDDEYCCLGVLCEVAVQNTVIPPATFGADTSCGYLYGVPGDENAGVLPQVVHEWAGFKDDDVEMIDTSRDLGQELWSSAIGMNDGRRRSFTQIAAAIRETYLKDAA